MSAFEHLVITRFNVRWKNYVPVFVDFPLSEYAGCPASLKSILSTRLSVQCRCLTTTKIDNGDDAVSKLFIQQIQDRFCGQKLEAVVFPLGYQLSQGDLRFDYSKGNHFISLIEEFEPSSFRTVLVREHNAMYLEIRVRQVYCWPDWQEVVHGGHIANHSNCGSIASVEPFLENFAVAAAPVLRDRQVNLRACQAKFLALALRGTSHRGSSTGSTTMPFSTGLRSPQPMTSFRCGYRIPDATASVGPFSCTKHGRGLQWPSGPSRSVPGPSWHSLRHPHTYRPRRWRKGLRSFAAAPYLLRTQLPSDPIRVR